MLRDITLGQYYSTNSVIHRLDPRVKLFATMLYIISIFVVNEVIGYLWCATFLIIIIKLSGVPVKFIFRGLKSIIVLIIITVVFNLFLTDGRILYRLWIFKITYEGILLSIMVTVRFILLIISSSVMTLTTTPKQLTDGMSTGLGFLKKIKFPVDEVAMMMSIALRFIPTLIDETDKIMKAQEARGASFNEGNLYQRMRAMLPILVPLFISSFRRAIDLATAMESRCYQTGTDRTAMKPLHYEKRDYIAYSLSFLMLFGAIALSVLHRFHYLAW